MKRTLAFLCALALMLSLVPGAAFAATQDLQAEIDAGAETIVLEADASDITVTRDTTIDLNGHDLSGVTVLSGTLYLQDSQTADYTVADGVYGHVTGVTGNVKAAEGYLQVGDSFHAVNLDIYAMTLRATDVGVYYKSHFAADEIVAAQVDSFGVALSVITAPNASNLETYCGYSDFTGFEAGEGANSVGTSTLLKGIMKAANGDSKNAKNAAMPVYGRAYIKTAEGYFFGETVKRSLQEQVEAIDKVWNKLTDAQKTPVLAMLEGYTSVMENWNIPNIRGIQVPGADADIEIPIEVTAENGVVTEAVTVEANGVCVTVPAGTKLAENATGLTVLVTEKETSEAGLTLEESEVLMPMDVHVEGLAADNTAPLTIYLGKVMAENLNMGNYAVYHVENGKANEMVLIPVDAEFTAHNQYKYSLDGELTLYMATFSEVAVVSEDPKWEGEFDYSWYDEVIKNNQDATYFEIRNADQLAAFGAIVGGMVGREQDSFSGKTVKLLADIDLNDAESSNESWIFHPIGYWNNEGTYERLPVEERKTAVSSGFYAFEGTFDGNGNTISNFYHNTWEIKGDHNWYDTIKDQYFRDGMGLFGKVYGGTVKNLTVKNFSSDGEIATTGVIAAYADCGATFENIAIFGCNPRVYNIGNGGIVGCVGWYTKDVTTTPVTFKNISVDQTNKISALWGTYDVSCGGLVGQYYATSGQGDGYANAGMTFTNCHVAAVMDVHNDVCANYQYYWYRYSGMMIGTIRANTTDANGYTVADTTGIEFIDCTYTLGDWNQYWYCELVKNSLASYTHDHQFSRLTTIASLSEIKDGETWLKEGNFVIPAEDNSSAECYHIFKDSNGNLYQHFHDGADESNNYSPYETFDLNGDGELNDLKEDRTCYFIPFNQVFNGLGYGVKPTYAYDDPDALKEVENGTVKAEEKFASLGTVTTYRPGESITLGQLVNSIVDETKLSKTSIYAAVSPATENDDVKATYSLNLSDWTNSTITFAEDCTGSAKIVITDYFYCTPTVIYLNPEQAAEKFTANTVGAQNAYTQITLGTLFGVKDGSTIGNVTATVTDPKGNETTVTGTSSDWTTKTIDLTKNGEWTVVIKDDDAYCAATKVTFAVNVVDKFEPFFKNDYLYRVGNVNNVQLQYLFEEIATDVALSAVNVAVTKEAGDASGEFTSKTNWKLGEIDFNGTGVVEVTISADGAKPVSIYLEVVDGKNAVAYSDLVSTSCVLLKDITMPTNGKYSLYDNQTLYGNGFTFNVVAGQDSDTEGGYVGGNGTVWVRNSTLDNVVIIGEVYTQYGGTVKDAYNFPTVLVLGESVIANSYISHGSSPVRVGSGCNLKLINSTLEGGIFANLDIRGGTVTLDRVTTINQTDAAGNSVSAGVAAAGGKAGLGIVVYTGSTVQVIIEENEENLPALTQYNCISKKASFTGEAKILSNAIFSSQFASLRYTDADGIEWVNTGILSMVAEVGDENIDDLVGYHGMKGDVNGYDGYVYTPVLDANYDFEGIPSPYVPSAQYQIAPGYKFDYTTKNNVPQVSGSNYYCVYDESTQKYLVSFDDGETFTWDADILTLTKADKVFNVSVSVSNGAEVSADNKITFDTAGDYTVTYTYTDEENYCLTNGEIAKYSAVYEKKINITVYEVVDTSAKTEFAFGSNGYRTETANNLTYVMPNVNATVDSNTAGIGVTTVGGVNIYYPIVSMHKSGSSSWYNYFSVFEAVTITDLDGTVHSKKSTELPSGLTVVGGFILNANGNVSTAESANGTKIFNYDTGKEIKCTTYSTYGLCYYPDSQFSKTGTSSRAEQTIVAKYRYTDSNGTPYYYYVGYWCEKHTKTEICVTPDTLVTLADGTQKEIQYVTYEDQLLVWNFYAGEYAVVPAALVQNHEQTWNTIIKLTFSDGTVTKAVNEHGYFDATLNEFAMIRADNASDYIGHAFAKADGDSYTTVTLENVEVSTEYIESYSIVAAYYCNFIADDMFSLTSPVIETNYFMPFEVGENMAFDAEKMAADIAEYGLYEYADFEGKIPYEVFEALNMKYIKIAVGKGLITYDQIIELLYSEGAIK